ncbi:hypothetical protein GZL_00656 [Streptomyces sp. 769]|nr:hypothetical protein GZL_00656 [Streptomyces sp. 769]
MHKGIGHGCATSNDGTDRAEAPPGRRCRDGGLAEGRGRPGADAAGRHGPASRGASWGAAGRRQAAAAPARARQGQPSVDPGHLSQLESADQTTGKPASPNHSLYQ